MLSVTTLGVDVSWLAGFGSPASTGFGMGQSAQPSLTNPLEPLLEDAPFPEALPLPVLDAALDDEDPLDPDDIAVDPELLPVEPELEALLDEELPELLTDDEPVEAELLPDEAVLLLELDDPLVPAHKHVS